MPTINPTQKNHNDTDRRDHFESMSRLEQLLGTFVAILVLFVALVLKSL